jgi:hypothetical protein
MGLRDHKIIVHAHVVSIGFFKSGAIRSFDNANRNTIRISCV